MEAKTFHEGLTRWVSYFMEAKLFSCRRIFCGGLVEGVVVFARVAF